MSADLGEFVDVFSLFFDISVSVTRMHELRFCIRCLAIQTTSLFKQVHISSIKVFIDLFI